MGEFPDAVTVRIGDQRVYANKQAIVLFGFSSLDELLVAEYDDIIADSDIDFILDRVERKRKGEPTAALYNSNVKKQDGSVVPVEVHTRNIVFNGQTANMNIIRDVSARVRFEEDLRLRDERLRVFLDSLDIGLAIWDKDLNYIDANRTILDRFGLSRAELIGKNIVEINPRVGDTPRLEAYKRVSVTGEPFISDEAVIPTSEGDRLFSVRSYKVGDGVGNITRDITEEHQLLHDLGERVKELTCIYGVANLTERMDISGESLIKGVLELIPPAWQFPTETCARIIFMNDIYTSSNFRETEWNQSSSITVYHENVGQVDVYYLSEMPEYDEGPFLKEERELINEIARKIGGFLENRAAQAKLQESEERYRTLIENTDKGVFTLTDLHFTSVNPAGARILGYDVPEALIGKPVDPFYADQDEVKDLREQLIANGRVTDFELFVYTKNKEVRIVSTTSTQEILEDGTILGTAIIHDITERKKLEREVQESEERYRTLFDSTKEGILNYDSSGIIISGNQAAADILGYENAREMIGLNAEVLYRGTEDREHLLQKLTEEGSLIDEEVSTRKKDGTFGKVSSTTTVYSDPITGEEIRSSLFQDISERKRSEERLSALHSFTLELDYVESVEDVVDVTLRIMEESLGFEFSSFQLLEDGGLVTVGSIGRPIWEVVLPLSGKGLTARAARESRTVLVNDVRIDPDYIQGFFDSLSELDVPIVVEERVLGVLNLESPLLDAFTVDDVRLLEVLAQNVGSALFRVRSVEDRKKVTDELRVSEERLSGFMESATEGFILLDTELRIIEANSSWLKLSGFTQSVFGMKLDDVIPSTDEMRLRHSEYRKVIETGEPVEFKQVVSPSNMNVFYDVKAFKVGDGLGIIIVDVTEQTLARREIEVLARFPEENTNPVLRIDAEGTILYANTASTVFLDSWGVKLGELIPENWWRITDQILSTNQVTQVDIEMVEKQWSFSFVPVQEAGYVNAYGMDVTEKKVFEDQLSALHRHSLELVNSESIENVGSTTLEIMSSVLGFEFSEILLVEDEYLCTLDLRGRIGDKLRLPISGKGITTRAVREEKTMFVPDVTKDPDYIQVSIKSLSEVDVPIMVDGNVVGVLNVEGQEVNRFTRNDAKLIEVLASNVGAAISRLRGDEEKRELERRILVEQVKVEQEQEIGQLKTQLMNTATHELRTPVTSILGYIELILADSKRDIPEDIRQDLQVVFRNANRLVTFTNDLLDVQRLTSGRVEIRRQKVDLVSTLNETLGELSLMFTEKQQVVDFVSPKEFMVDVDEVRISQLFINLFRNANKFTPMEGNITVTVEPNEDNVTISVKDTGVGLSEEDIGKLFDPFPGIRHGLGVTSTGLGLAICKGIVDLHNGAIWAESDGPGKGSTFYVKLPL